MANLYNTIAQIRDFKFDVNEDGEVTNYDQLEKLEIERDRKLEYIGQMVKNARADKKMYAEERKSFSELEKAAANQEAYWTTYLERCLNGEEFKSQTVKITYRKSETTEYEDVKYIPEKFLIPQPAKPDLKAIKEAINSGEEVNGCWIEEHRRIQIK